ncbi:MAG: PEGA domain-containing protein [Terracidiphilus sp.]
MPKKLLAVLFLVCCPLLIAQQAPAPAAAAPAPQTPAAAPGQPPPPDTLLDGTPVKLRISQTISSADARVDQEVPFEVVEDVKVDNVVVIPKGSAAIGTVTEAQPRRRMGRGGKLNITISYVRLADQEKAQLRAVKDGNGGGHVGAMTGAIVATSIVFFPAAPLFLFMKGKDITIPQGTEITAFVEGDMHLDLAKFGATPPVSAGGPASAQASLIVASSPPGAEIDIDGGFVGDTPSTVSVAPGSHEVTVKKTGFADWTRKLNVTGGSVHLDATLDAAPAH